MAGALSIIKVASLNCQGLNEYYKRMALFDYLKCSDLAVIFLQETKLKPENERKYMNEWHNGKCIFNSTVGAKSGTAILINHRGVEIVGPSYIDVEGRVIAIDIIYFGCKFHLVNSYGPNKQNLKLAFISRLYLYMDSNRPIIWAGDHNIATDPLLDRYPQCFDGDYGRNQVIQIQNTFDLLDSCRVLYPGVSMFTYRRGTSRSRIDKICVSSNFGISAFCHRDLGFTDHDMIVATLRFTSSYQRGPGVWRNNCSYYGDDNFLDDFKAYWAIDKPFDYCKSMNILKWWESMKYNYKLFFIKHCKEKLMLKRREEQMLEGGLHEMVIALGNDPSNRDLVAEYNRRKKLLVNTRIRNAKEKLFKKEAKYIMNGERPVKDFFDRFKNKMEHPPILGLMNEEGEETSILGMIEVAENYYRNLFTERVVEQNMIDKFLRNIRANRDCVRYMAYLMDPITIEEIWTAICSFANGRTPGIDGLSVEFYKVTFSVIKYYLKEIYNQFMAGRKIPAKFKTSLIKLVYKDGARNDIGNYRPISLLNTDYKIFTKILSTRLQPILGHIIHDTQYAQPGRDLNEMNRVVRDLVYDMENGGTDAFFVSLDFRKAYDSINHGFLLQVLGNYGFPDSFICLIKELFRDAGAHVMVNGYKSSKIKLKSGIRQGCPLSRDLFTLQSNPLWIFLNDTMSGTIGKYRTKSNKEYLTLAYLDDGNLFTNSISSLLNAFFHIRMFKRASGLEMNMSKTSGKFFNIRNIFRVEHLPGIRWEETIKVLKVVHCPRVLIDQQWRDVLNKVKKEIDYCSVIATTFQAKANISKNKLLPMMAYLGSVHVMPDFCKRKLDKMLLKFLVPFASRGLGDDEISDKLTRFAAPKYLGGYATDHLTVHLDLLLLKPLMQYVKSKEDNALLPKELYFVEYYIGMRLCMFYGLPINNCTPHADMPNAVYGHAFNLLRFFKITKEEMVKGSVNNIYKRIMVNKNNALGVYRFKFYRIMSKFLPSYLQSFNYKLHFDYLPVNTVFRDYALDNDTCCYFCHIGPESIYHVFSTCEKLRPLWQLINEVHYIATDDSFDYARARQAFQIDMVSVDFGRSAAFERTIIYVNSVINWNIWKLRNDIKFNFDKFGLQSLVNRIIRSVGGRKGVDIKLPEAKQIPYIEGLYNAFIYVRRTFPFDNG